MNELRVAAEWLLAASIKGSVLILMVSVIQWITRDFIPARWRHAMWLLVFLRLVIPAGPQSPVSLFNAARLFAEQQSSVAIGTRPPVQINRGGPIFIIPAEEVTYRRFDTRGIAMFIGLLSVAGAAAFGLRLLVTSLRFRRSLRRQQVAQPAISKDAIAVLDECKQRLGVHAKVRIVETDHVTTPALHGVFHPTLLMPRDFLTRFTSDELRFVFLHELAHLRRGDVLANCATSAIAVLHWFNPLVWLAIRRVREERELACDEMTLACLQQEERPAYGRTILKLLEMFRPPAAFPAVLGILSDKQQIKRRLTMITQFRNHPRSTFFFLALVLALGAVSLTDARAGADPAADATLEKLEKSIDLKMTNVTLADVLNAVASQAGVVITQSEKVVASPVQQRRITIEADQVPAHAVLMETLSALNLGLEPTAEGVTITDSPALGDRAGRRVIKHKVKVPDNAEAHIEIEANGTPVDEVDKQVFIRKVDPQKEDGTIRRNLKMKISRNGIVTTGTLRIEISSE